MCAAAELRDADSSRSASASALRESCPKAPSFSAIAASSASDSCKSESADSTLFTASSCLFLAVDSSKITLLSSVSSCASLVSDSSKAACTSSKLGLLEDPPSIMPASIESPWRLTRETPRFALALSRSSSIDSTTTNRFNKAWT